MKIIRLEADNIKRLRVVEITPSGDVVTISGKNGSGKTSILDSIWWALGGEKNVQDIPIRTGAEKARIRLDLGTIVVERKFSASGLRLRTDSHNCRVVRANRRKVWANSQKNTAWVAS